jgi:hypothetical protein
MLRTQMIGLALMAALVMSTLAVASAPAADHLWLINGKQISAALKIHSRSLLLLSDDSPFGGNFQSLYIANSLKPGRSVLTHWT